MSSEEASGSSEYSSEEESFEFEPVDPNELGEGEGTRGMSDILAMVGIGGGSEKPSAPLLDVNGNPIEAVYTEDGQYVPPRLVDESGNVVHDGPPPKEEKEGMSTGKKVAVGGAVVGGAALASIAALTAGAAATGVGVHYYRKKKGGKKGKKDKKGKDKKDKGDKKDKKGKDKKDKGDKKDKKDKKDKHDKHDKKDKKDKKKKK